MYIVIPMWPEGESFWVKDQEDKHLLSNWSRAYKR